MNIGSPQPYRLVGALLLAAATLQLAAVTDAAAQVRGTSLIMSHPQEPPNWNYWATGATALTVPTFHNVLEPLVEKLGDGSVAPLLAESWKISNDGLVYEFKIRQAKFHDGTALNAADVVYSLLKNKASPQAPMRTPLATMVSVEAVDARTVKLKLSAPSQRLLSELGQAAGVIVAKDSHEKLNLNAQMIGTGPYVFGEYKPDRHLILTRFDGYWGTKPYFQQVTHRFIPDETAAINALLSGQIDIVGTVLGEGIDRVASVGKNPRFRVVSPLPTEVNYIFLSTRNEALRDPRVRQAIAHAVEREEVLVGGVSGFARVTCQLVIPSTEKWNNGYCPYKHDPARARQLLAAAGRANLTLDFPFLTVAEFPLIKDVLVAQLAKVGITLKPRALDLATWLERVNTNGEYEFSNLTSGVKAEAFVCKGGRQPLGRDNSVVCDTAFDQLVARSDTILARDEYERSMAEMMKLLADSAWVIPMLQKNPPSLVRADLEGVKAYRTRLEFDLRKLRWTN